MADCIFCLIVQGKVPARKVYEDKDTLAFLDINPRVKGHTVVITKKHAETLLDLDDKGAAGLFSAVKKTAVLLKTALHATGFNTGNNNDKSAGQAVNHVHIHIMPRYAEDKFQHAGFEAAFPVDEEAKKQLDETLKTVQATQVPEEHHEKEEEHDHDNHEKEHAHDHDTPSKPASKIKGVFINEDYPDDDVADGNSIIERHR